MILLHYTGMPDDGEARLRRLCTPGQRRLRRTTIVHGRRARACAACRRPTARLARGRRRAGAAAGRHQLAARSGSRSPMRGHARRPARTFPPRQIAARDRAVPRRTCARRRGARRNRVLAHSDVAPGTEARSGRALSVGSRWPRPASDYLVRARRRSCDGRTASSWAASAGAPIEALQAALALIRLRDRGRRRSSIGARPWTWSPRSSATSAPARVDGIADHSTMSTLHALLASLPADAMNTVVAAK